MERQTGIRYCLQNAENLFQRFHDCLMIVLICVRLMFQKDIHESRDKTKIKGLNAFHDGNTKIQLKCLKL